MINFINDFLNKKRQKKLAQKIFLPHHLQQSQDMENFSASFLEQRPVYTKDW